ncbi:hypothetical protein CC1G_13276 [Coprinopsis cinerea okayama7|uniref:Uncharacterized protein n=1 Tax=Coprinopsis cinerea (strain Okayama-7 / 130 / ATCC MYA-4618 / FGSC 9003) TaxID=240176 RepID=A8PIB1_COPC7|nr:hypothetical protein CC1G_13276 [Coprinopsis cinerea okayama7\|eukprot:XP_001841544.1 hypothetical protein CC1G_13276 [Coprinopsis cinerea okayama7\
MQSLRSLLLSSLLITSTLAAPQPLQNDAQPTCTATAQSTFHPPSALWIADNLPAVPGLQLPLGRNHVWKHDRLDARVCVTNSSKENLLISISEIGRTIKKIVESCCSDLGEDGGCMGGRDSFLARGGDGDVPLEVWVGAIGENVC